jgi:hypothetical protein
MAVKAILYVEELHMRMSVCVCVYVCITHTHTQTHTQVVICGHSGHSSMEIP